MAERCSSASPSHTHGGPRTLQHLVAIFVLAARPFGSPLTCSPGSCVPATPPRTLTFRPPCNHSTSTRQERRKPRTLPRCGRTKRMSRVWTLPDARTLCELSCPDSNEVPAPAHPKLLGRHDGCRWKNSARKAGLWRRAGGPGGVKMDAMAAMGDGPARGGARRHYNKLCSSCAGLGLQGQDPFTVMSRSQCCCRWVQVERPAGEEGEEQGAAAAGESQDHKRGADAEHERRY
jgi:hypothetical protein